MALIIQLFCLVFIIGLGILLFKFFPNKFTPKIIALIAIFAVLKIVLQLFSMVIPLFGVPSLRIGISQLPLMLGGVILGPVGGFVLGLIVDLLGLIVTPTNYPFLGFTLGNILVAVIPALIFQWIKAKNRARVGFYGFILIFAMSIIGLICLVSSIKVGSIVIHMTSTHRSFVLFFSLFLLLMMYLARSWIRKYRPENIVLYDVWIIAVVFVELIVNILMTPIWLDLMYGIPFITSSLLRVIKAGVMINVNGFLGFFVLIALKKLKKNS